jgi:MYXO-CTERM domain-containing protein
MISDVVRAYRTRLLGSVLLAASLLWPSTASAVMQTGGAIIPKQSGAACNNNVGVCINGNEVVEGADPNDPGAVIDAVDTATISQETFSPLCELTFRVVARGASYKNTFGWYEVKRDADGKALAPALADLHVFLGCADPINAEKTLTIPKGVAEIGFFLANNGGTCVATQPDPLGPTLTAQPSNLFFSQRAFNSDGDGLIHLLVWQSRANPNAFYFGWEDLSGGGDNDFEDLLTYVTGIQCAGGGEPCEAEGEGVCGDGVMQCQDGVLTCVPTKTASPETCNGLNDDCDDETDEGDDLCPRNEICVRGHCEPPCGTGEFRCGSGEVCVEGVCLDKACADVKCDAGSVCRGGKCVSPCDDVVCPYGATCQQGVCVDVCVGVECDPGFVCEPRESSDGATLVGVCTSCDCRGCPDGQTCSEHRCIDNSCVDKTCDASAHCVDGDCIDNCAGVSCPRGEICEAGACIDDPTSGSGGAGSGGNGSGGSGDDDIVIEPGGNDGPGTGGASDDDDGGVAGDKVAIEAKGCGCSLPGSANSSAAALTLAALGAALALSRRRRRC